VNEKIFGESDLHRWAESGLISQAQLQTLLAQEAERITQARSMRGNVERGLTPVTVLALFGAFLALFGIAVFVFLTWDDWSDGTRIAITGVPAGVLLALGGYLRARSSYQLTGGLLFMLGTALLPVFVGAVGQAYTQDQFRSLSEDADRLVAVLSVSLGLTAVALLVSRVHYAAFVVATLFILTTMAIAAARGYQEEESLLWSTLGASGFVLAAAVGLYVLRAPAYGLWAGNAGHIGFYVSTVYLL